MGYWQWRERIDTLVFSLIFVRFGFKLFDPGLGGGGLPLYTGWRDFINGVYQVSHPLLLPAEWLDGWLAGMFPWLHTGFYPVLPTVQLLPAIQGSLAWLGNTAPPLAPLAHTLAGWPWEMFLKGEAEWLGLLSLAFYRLLSPVPDAFYRGYRDVEFAAKTGYKRHKGR